MGSFTMSQNKIPLIKKTCMKFFFLFYFMKNGLF